MSGPEVRIDCSGAETVVLQLERMEARVDAMILRRELGFERSLNRFLRWTWLAAGMLGALLGFTAGVAHGATVRVPLAWTQPDTAGGAGLVRRLEARSRNMEGAYAALALYADSLSAASPSVAPPRAVQHAWALVPDDWRAGGSQLQVRGCNGAGCSAWSNVYVVATGVPDTVWVLKRADVDRGWLPPVDGIEARQTGGRVAWALQPSDTLVGAWIVHFEDVQRAERARLCQLFGYWCLRGARQSCPVAPAPARNLKTTTTRRSVTR